MQMNNMEWGRKKANMKEEVENKCTQVHMEIRTSKFCNSTYHGFKEKSRALPKIILEEAIYGFKAREVRNPPL